jgi:DNA-directed RNA polymerase specialized sigma24 family protein
LQDAELLGRIGRNPLAAILDLLAPALAEQDISLPDPRLPDTRYFAELAAMLRSQPVKVTVYLPPFLGAGSHALAQEPLPAGATRAPEPAPANLSVTAKVFQLLTALNPDNRLRKAPPIKVFLLRFRQNLSLSQIARTCDCGKSLVALRLQAIRKKLPWQPKQLREMSAQVEAMQDALTDPRARSIYRKGSVYGDEDDGPESD